MERKVEEGLSFLHEEPTGKGGEERKDASVREKEMEGKGTLQLRNDATWMDRRLKEERRDAKLRGSGRDEPWTNAWKDRKRLCEGRGRGKPD
jgi:hypothetical protein